LRIFLAFVFTVYASQILIADELIYVIENVIRVVTIFYFFRLRYLKKSLFIFIILMSSASSIYSLSVAPLLYGLDVMLFPMIFWSRKTIQTKGVLIIPCLAVILSVMAAQYAELSDLYYPYSDSYTMGAFRNKASISLGLIFLVLSNSSKTVWTWIALIVLGGIIVLSFRRTTWIIAMFGLASIIFKSFRSVLVLSLVIILFTILYSNEFSYLFNSILAARDSVYMFTLNTKEWRVQEYIIWFNDVLSDFPENVYGHVVSDSQGWDFWGNYGVDNSIHVDFIRSYYYYGVSGMLLYLMFIYKVFRKLKGRYFLVVLPIWLSVYFYGGGFFSHLLNGISLAFLLLYYEQNSRNSSIV